MQNKTEFTVAICDDNPDVRNMVRTVVEEKLLQENFLFDVIEFSSAEDVLDYISCQESRHIELLYLDIEMHGMSGLQLMQYLVESEFVWRIAFVTSHTENILSSFSIKTIGFIVKPLTDEEIKKKLSVVLQEWKKNRSFLCKDINGRYQVFKYNNILYFEAARNYCSVFYQDGLTRKIKSVLLDERIGELEKKLADMGFLRIHKSYLVNLLYVESLNEQAKMYCGQVMLPIGRTYKERSRRVLLKYVAGKVKERT